MMSKTILSEIDGFTPLPDLLVKRYGLFTAAVFGRMWRNCQMQDGICRATLDTLASELNISKMTIIRHIETLVYDDFLKDTTPDRKNKPHVYADTGKVAMYNKFGMALTVTESKSEKPTLTESDSALTLSDSQSHTELLEDSKKRESKKSLPLEWKIAHGEPITEEDVTQPALENNALIEFEKALGFGTLPWDSNTVWTSFKKFVVKVHTANSKVFADYKEWRDGDGKYKAFSNRKIRENPKMFMDTGYPEYEASKMYHRTDETRPEYQPVPDTPVVRTPRPANVPRPNINLRGV
jgi:hypothetical protein